MIDLSNDVDFQIRKERLERNFPGYSLDKYGNEIKIYVSPSDGMDQFGLPLRTAGRRNREFT